MFHTIFFDLDNTLYPKSSGLMNAIRDRIIAYMRDVMKLGEEEIISVRKYSLQKFGTTLPGLMELYGIDMQEYLDFVHDLKLEDYLDRNPALNNLLESLPQKKVIFSNADRGHIQQVLKYLDVESFFDTIIDVHILLPNVKPQVKAYEKARLAVGLSSWEGCVFIDDHLPNIQSAENLGIFSILVDESLVQNHKTCIQSLDHLPAFIQSQGRN